MRLNCWGLHASELLGIACTCSTRDLGCPNVRRTRHSAHHPVTKNRGQKVTARTGIRTRNHFIPSPVSSPVDQAVSLTSSYLFQLRSVFIPFVPVPGLNVSIHYISLFQLICIVRIFSNVEHCSVNLVVCFFKYKDNNKHNQLECRCFGPVKSLLKY